MGVLNAFREAVSDDSFVIYECRDCGEKNPADVEECPSCDSSEIARYQF